MHREEKVSISAIFGKNLMRRRYQGKKRIQLFQILLLSVFSLILAINVVITVGTLYVQADELPDEELILYYDFNLQGDDPTEIKDVSGNGNTGYIRRLSGAVGGDYSIEDVSIYGKPWKALHLFGEESSNYLQLPEGVLDGRDAVTISVWVKLTEDIAYQRIWDFGTGTDKYIYLLSDGYNHGFEGYSSAISKTGYNSGKGEKGVSKGDNIDKNRWILTTVVLDGSNMSLYADGRQIGKTVDTGITLSELGHTTKNYIGYSQYGDGPSKGFFAEVKIYGRALTAEEIQAMYYVDDEGIVSADYTDLDLGDISKVTEELVLPEKGINGSSITWTSQNHAVSIKNNKLAKVKRPAKGTKNSSGTLTAEIRYRQASVVKTFNLTVLSEYTHQQIVNHDVKKIKRFFRDLSKVTSDIPLPAEGDWGSKIEWSSNNEAVRIKDNTAKVTRPKIGAENAVGTLEAVVTSGSEKKIITFDITVLALHKAASIKKIEQINVNTRRGKSPALPASVKVIFSDGSMQKLKTIWPKKIEKSKYEKKGTFVVEGSIAGVKDKITANVTVTDEKEEVKNIVSSEFDLKDVSLDKIGNDGSILTQNRARTLDYLRLLDNKRMLYNFYETFGQDEKIKGTEPLEGWETPTGLLRGHSTGHYISALSLAYASTKDEEINDKLKEIIHEIRNLQKMSKGDPQAFQSMGVDQTLWSKDPETWGEGYIGAFPPDQFALLEQYTPYSQIWAPYYTLHKLMAGFLDAYKYTGNEEALQTAKALGTWTYRRLSGCSQKQLTKMWDMYIAGEFGGFNESMAQLYVYTKDEDFLKGAKLFDNTIFFDNLAANIDDIQGRHVNQHIPQVIGALEIYGATLVKGTPEVYYYNIAENFWKMAVSRYSYSIGGLGTSEMFTEPYRQANSISGTANCETDAAYNMLKLTKMLNNYNPDNAEYMDYYERTLYNQILASQTPNITSDMHNGTTFMLPIGPGSKRTYSKDYDSFSCCYGIGMENHVKYQEAAYFKTDDTLYVGLYLPSTLTWEEKGVKMVQETVFPSEKTKLTVSELEGRSGQSFNLKLRVPYWAENGFKVKVNGEAVKISSEVSSYTVLEHVQTGDVIEITMPWALHLDTTPDTIGKSMVASIMYGPFVMAAKNDSTEWKTLLLSENLEDSVKTGVNEINGFPTLTVNGYDFAPMFAPEFASQAYHAYFKVVVAADDGSNWYEVKMTNSTPKNGNFLLDTEMVKEGGSFDVTVQPKEGYMLKYLIVNDKKVEVIDNKYTVKNVSQDTKMEGCFRRILPLIPDPEHLEYSADVSSDYTVGHENLEGIKINWEPTVSNGGIGRGWGNWPQKPGTEHYVRYDWDIETSMDRFDIFWYDDEGGTRVPASVKILYLTKNGKWEETPIITSFENMTAVDQYNTIRFYPVTTSAIKLVMTVHPESEANGIYRWKVSDSRAAKNSQIEKDNKKLLRDAIHSADMFQDKNKYSDECWNNLQTALEEAEKVYNNDSAKQDEIDAAVHSLNMAVRNIYSNYLKAANENGK